jgi:hypothetical protein
MQTTRRNLFKFVGGSAVGALFTPAPWRLITDTALWSENWPGIPRPEAGEIRFRYTNCSLCPTGCAVRARCVGDQPISLAGVKGHPLSYGALCPWGVAAHQLPYHPARLRTGSVTQAAAAAADAISRRTAGERVAVLDLRPGRTASWTYRRAAAALPGGTYLADPEPEWGFDLSAARTVLSLGASLVDGWGTPGSVFAARGSFRLIQADAVETRTAATADVWLPVRPDSELALAGAVSGDISAGDASRLTGLSEKQIADTIASLRANGPSLVVAPRLSPEVLRANVALGAVGKTLVERRETPVPDAWRKAALVTALAAVPDGSIRLLLIDESAPGEYQPWLAIAPKLASHAVVIAFGWTAEGYGKHVDFVLPAPVWGEALDDIEAAVDGASAAFRLAVPLIPPQTEVTEPAKFIAKLAGVSAEEALRERADAIHKIGRGQVFTPADCKTEALKEMTPDDFWKALNAGACWMDEKSPLPYGRGSVPIPSRDREGAVSSGNLAIVSAESSGPPLNSPLISKLYRESNLRQAPDRVALAPATARAAGLTDGARAFLETGGERLPVVVTLDPGIPPDVVRVARADLGAFARGKVVRA